LQNLARILIRISLALNKIDVFLMNANVARINQPQRNSRMKNYTTYTVTIFLATIAVSFAAPDNDTMLAKENAAWQAFKDKKADDFKKVVADDLVAVYAEGISDMAKEMSDMQKWDMKSFAISDYKITSYGTDTVISTYTVTVSGTFDGKDASGTYNASSVWMQRNGEWQAIYHTNIKQAGPTTDAQKKE
jgi:hypothetical protein